MLSNHRTLLKMKILFAFLLFGKNYSMNKSLIAMVIDIAFRYLIIFFIAFAWLRFYIYNGIVCGLIAFAISIAINTIISAITNHRTMVKKNTLKEGAKIEECALKLATMDNYERNKFFASLMPDATNLHTYKSYTSFKLNAKKMIMVYCDIGNKEKLFENLSRYKNKCEKIIMVANEWKSEIRKLANNLNFDIVLLDSEQMFHLLYTKTKSFPESEITYKSNTKTCWKDVLDLCLQKRNWFRYFWAGLLIIFASFVMPFRNYYIVWGSALLVLSFLCIIRPLWKKPIMKNWLD